VTGAWLAQAHWEDIKGFGWAMRCPPVLGHLFLIRDPYMRGISSFDVPFGACWKEKQTMSLVAPRSTSPGLVVFMINCSDNIIFIRPWVS